MNVQTLEKLTLTLNQNGGNAEEPCYYRIVSEACIYGDWLDCPDCLADRKSKGLHRLHGAEKSALEMATGKINYRMEFIPEQIREAARRLEENGYLERCPYGADAPQKQSFQNHLVHSAKWAVTGRCNYRCRHCFLSAPEAKFGELPLEDCRRIIREMEECGIRAVDLTGGEPLVRKDFPIIAEELSRHHIRLKTIATNGALVTEQLLKQLEELHQKPDFFMSYDGVGWHDWLRGIDGAEKALFRAFELLGEHGFRAGSAVALHRNNAPVLRETIQRLAKAGAFMAIINRMVDFGEWKKYGQGLTLTQRELLEIYLEYLPHYYEDGMPISVVLNRMMRMKKNSWDYQITAFRTRGDCNGVKVCEAAYRAAFITSDGKLAPCISIAGMDGQQENFADLSKMHLRDALEKSRYAACVGATVKDYYDANPECAACEYREYCQGGCRAQALEFDDTNYMGMDRHRCEFFKEQFAERILQRMAETVPQARCVNLPEDYPLKPLK